MSNDAKGRSRVVQAVLALAYAGSSVGGPLACAESSEPSASERDSGSTRAADAQAPATDADVALDADVATDAATDAAMGLGSDLCRADSECALTDNCCECSVGLTTSEVEECTVSCEQTQCEQWGLVESDVACVASGLGRQRCNFETLTPSCGPLNTVDVRERCEEGPAACPMGTIAELDESRTCWSGRCVPINLCGSVEGCAQCQDDEACFATVITGYSIALGEPGPDGEFEEVDRVTFRCEPRNPTCEGEPSCECEPDFCRNGNCVDGPLSQWPYDTGIGNLDELSEGAVICVEHDG